MNKRGINEPRYKALLSLRDKKGLSKMGLITNQAWHDEPKQLLFILARYKFVAKMLSGKRKVLEVGCGDAFGTRIVLVEVGSVCAIDIEPFFVKDANKRMEKKWEFNCKVHDILSSPVDGPFDAAYSLDVIEHIPKAKEQLFMSNIVRSLSDEGVLIVGMPSMHSQVYASKFSKKCHVNCKGHAELKKLMLKYFHNAFIFSMNDEVVHTGFYPLAHYLFALGVGKR